MIDIVDRILKSVELPGEVTFETEDVNRAVGKVTGIEFDAFVVGVKKHQYLTRSVVSENLDHIGFVLPVIYRGFKTYFTVTCTRGYGGFDVEAAVKYVLFSDTGASVLRVPSIEMAESLKAEMLKARVAA